MTYQDSHMIKNGTFANIFGEVVKSVKVVSGETEVNMLLDESGRYYINGTGHYYGPEDMARILDAAVSKGAAVEVTYAA